MSELEMEKLLVLERKSAGLSGLPFAAFLISASLLGFFLTSIKSFPLPFGSILISESGMPNFASFLLISLTLFTISSLF
jgi:hypothetical protein